LIDTVNKTMHKVYKPYVPKKGVAKPKRQGTIIGASNPKGPKKPKAPKVDNGPVIWGIKTTPVPKDETNA
jgi:hypothetical protein